jgi:AcrR family transcriptional regulator
MPKTDSPGERILDAALDALLTFGIRRTTMEGVAKRAGVSHMTVYRRWPTKNDLLLAVVMREVERLFAAVDRDIAGMDTFRDKLVAGFTGIFWFVHCHPLLGRTLETDPESVLPILTTGAGPAMDLAINYLTHHLEETPHSQRSGFADPRGIAEIFVRLTHSLLLLPPADFASRSDVEDYARTHVLPLARAASTPQTARAT